MLLGLASSPVTLLPFVAGVTAMVGSWAFDVMPEFGLFTGVVGILVSAGTFFTRLLVHGESAAKKALEEIHAENLKERERALDGLEDSLKTDGEPRTERALRDLRLFAKTFEDEKTWASGLDARSVFEIRRGVAQLYERCVKSLEKTFELWQTARKMSTREAQNPILQQRERTMGEVAKSIAQLGTILVEIQNLSRTDGAAPGLAKVREELDQSLAFAKSVDSKMQALDREYDTSEFE